jgi:hypothetical protein
VRPFNIPMFNTTAVWTNAAIAGAAFCIALYHNGIAGENTRMAGEIMAMTAALGGAFPLMLFGIRTFLLWTVSADVAPIGLQDEGSLGGKADEDDDDRNAELNASLSGLDRSKGGGAGSSPNKGKNPGGGKGGKKSIDEMDEFEMADTFAKKQPVNWPLRPADEIKLTPLPTMEVTDDNLFVRRNGPAYRHTGPVWADETPDERARREFRERQRGDEASPMHHLSKANLQQQQQQQQQQETASAAAAASAAGDLAPSPTRAAAATSPPENGASADAAAAINHDHLLDKKREQQQQQQPEQLGDQSAAAGAASSSSPSRPHSMTFHVEVDGSNAMSPVGAPPSSSAAVAGDFDSPLAHTAATAKPSAAAAGPRDDFASLENSPEQEPVSLREARAQSQLDVISIRTVSVPSKPDGGVAAVSIPASPKAAEEPDDLDFL